MIMDMNYTAILVCAILAMIIGFIWYGPLFGKSWMKIMGVEAMSAEQKKAMEKGMWAMYFLQFILSLVTAYVLDFVLVNWVGDMAVVGVAILVWFGFIMTTEAGAALWSGRPRKTAWKMFLISTSGHFITFIVFGIVLNMWK